MTKCIASVLWAKTGRLSPRFWKRNEWSYPYAYEDKETKKLYVAYAKNKEDCEIAIIPTESLE